MFKETPYIIAEIGSNWTSLQDCLDSIIQAKLAGADAAKFQLYSWYDLYGVQARDVHDGKSSYMFDPEKPEKSWRNLPGTMPLKWLPDLKHQCDRVEIDFMCSAFSPELIDVVDPYVKTHKLASSEMCHVRMLEKFRKIGKPLIMSTGAQTVSDIWSAIRVLRGDGGAWGSLPPLDVTLMYCVSSYPANETDLDLIMQLCKEFSLPPGFSDHSLDYLNLPRFAWTAFGATVIEKHFTAIEATTPDSGHSLNPDQFRNMVNKIRGRHVSVIGPVKSELDMLTKHKRRLIAIRDIKQGSILQENVNFGIYRSLKEDMNALDPFKIEYVNNRLAKRDIKAGDGIGQTDF